MKLPLRFVAPLGVFVVLLGLLGAGLRLDPHEVPSPLVGKPAPDFALERVDDTGKTMRRADLLGRTWVLNVWASWCSACRQEHPLLMDLARSQPAPLVGLDHKDTRSAAQAWLARHGDPYAASLFDPDGRAGRDFGVYGVPETFVIDRHGIVRFKHVGPLTHDIVETRIRPLLKALDG